MFINLTIAQTPFLNLASELNEKSEFDSSVQIIRKSLRTNIQSKQIKIQAYILLGNNYLRMFKPDYALSSFQKALKLLKKDSVVDTRYFIESLLGSSRAHCRNVNLDSALYYNHEALKIIQNSEFYDKYYGIAMFHYGRIYSYSDKKKASKYYKEALNTFSEINKNILELYLLAGDFYLEKLNMDSANYCLEKGIELATGRHKDHLFLSYLFILEGFISFFNKDFYKAIEILNDKALPLVQRSGTAESYIEGEIYRFLTFPYRNIGNIEKAKIFLEKSLAQKKKHFGNDHFNVARDYENLSYVCMKLNQTEEATKYVVKAIQIYEKTEQLDYLFTGYTSLSTYLMNEKKYEESLLYLNLAENLVSDLTYSNYADVKVNRQRALVYLNYNKLDSATKYIDKSIKKRSKIDHIDQSVYELYLIKARIYEQKHLYGLALDYYQKSLSVFEKLEIYNHPGKLECLNSFAHFLLSNNKPDEAKYNLNEAVKTNLIDTSQWAHQYPKQENIINKYEMIKTFWLKGRYDLLSQSVNAASVQNLSNALSHFQFCIELIFDSKKGYTSQADKVYQQGLDLCNNVFNDAIHALYKFYEINKSNQWVNEAARLIELKKSSIILENINTISALNIIPDSLSTLEISLKNDINYLSTQIIKSTPAESGNGKLEKTKGMLFSTQEEYKELVSFLEDKYPNYYNLKYNFDVQLVEETQKRLNSNDLLIEYYVSDSATYLLASTKDTTLFQALPLISVKQIEQFRKTLTSDFVSEYPSAVFNNITTQAHYLYNQILSPVLSNIDTTKINSLIIIPDGLLNLIPFEALITSDKNNKIGDYKSLTYLLKKYNISYAYSATSLLKMSEMAKIKDEELKVISFAPAKFQSTTVNLSPLKWNKTEVTNLGIFFDNISFTDGIATELNFKNNIDKYPIAHFATHALLDHEEPMYSKLLFAPAQDTLEDGMLHTFELYNMRLNTKMVVLSACNTGYGKLQRGEGVMSLARAFAYAGCPSVVMSHWAVDDKSTAEVMKYFYEYLSDGQSKDEALRNAKLKFLTLSSPIYHHPYYWNNFVIMGDSGSIINSDKYLKWYVIVITIAIFALALFASHFRAGKSSH